MKFKLRFPENKITYWADRAPNITALQAIGRSARARGSLTRSEFLTLCNVKSPRARSHYEENTAKLIKEVTAISLLADSERVEIQALMILAGVSWPMASFILHFCSKRKYPILDYRALWSLSIEKAPVYTFDFWMEYVACSREIALRNGVSMRCLDSSLWQFSKENQ